MSSDEQQSKEIYSGDEWRGAVRYTLHRLSERMQKDLRESKALEDRLAKMVAGADTVSDTSRKKSSAKKSTESRHPGRDAKICRRILELGRQGLGTTAGVKQTAKEECMTEAAVWKVWERYGDRKKPRRKPAR